MFAAVLMKSEAGRQRVEINAFKNSKLVWNQTMEMQLKNCTVMKRALTNYFPNIITRVYPGKTAISVVW